MYSSTRSRAITVLLENVNRGGPLRLDGREEPVIGDHPETFLNVGGEMVEVVFAERVDEAALSRPRHDVHALRR
jgi:hypothetical protein